MTADPVSLTQAQAIGSSPERLTVAVVIPAFTMKRWDLLRKAVASARNQTAQPDEVVVCIDNNEELLAKACGEWQDGLQPPVRVIANRHRDHLSRVTVHQAAHGTSRRFGAGSARNTATQACSTDVIAFMDDDAWAEPEWIEELLRVFDDPTVEAVGGPPIPDYETQRPGWYPPNFDWVFGCAYSGLPTVVSPLAHLIGANMAVRRAAWEAIGGFVGSDFDDLNLCMRLADRFGSGCTYYTPHAIVHHFVTAERVTWRYFWRRCYFVNREKVRVFQRMGSAANLRAEREFVVRAITSEVVTCLKRVAKGDLGSLKALAAMLAGISLAGLGNVRGQIEYRIGRGGSA